MPTTEIPNGVSYSPPDYQRGYQPPLPQPEWRAPDVDAPAVKVDGNPVQRTHAAVVHANNEFQKHLDTTQELSAHLTAEGYQARIAEFQNTSAARAVDTEFEAVTAYRDAAADNVAKVKRDLSPAGDTATELRATRYRDRVLRQLDAKDSGALFEAANGLLASATREQLGTLLEELPSYLQARGMTNIDWIDAAVAAVVPEYAAAHAELMRAEKAFVITRQNVGFVRQGFAKGRPAKFLVDPGEYA